MQMVGRVFRELTSPSLVVLCKGCCLPRKKDFSLTSCCLLGTGSQSEKGILTPTACIFFLN